MSRLGKLAERSVKESGEAVGLVHRKKAKRKQKVEPVLPDEEELKRTKRRDAAKRFGRGGSGRSSTMLSDGLGG